MPATHSLLPRLAAAAALSILAACAQRLAPGSRYAPPTPYIPPPSSQDSAPLAMRARLPAGSLYALNVLADTPACSASRRVGMARDGVVLPATALATERWQTLEVDTFDPATRLGCQIRVSFTPRHGRSYLLSAKTEKGHCNALVFDNTDPQAPQLESSFRYRNTNKEACMPLASAPAYLRDEMAQEAVSATDLPINPDEGALSSAKAPRSAPAGPKPAETVSDDDLQGLIRH